MKTISFISRTLILSAALIVAAACTNHVEQELTPAAPEQHTMKMTFIASVPSFDAPCKKAPAAGETTSSWNDGDKVYLAFMNGTTAIPGCATYSKTDGWTVTYSQTLPTGSSLSCQAYYFEAAVNHNDNLVSLDRYGAIYEDLAATYSLSAEELIVQATLAPKTARIRFHGTKPGEQIYIAGITTYNSFVPSTFTFASECTIDSCTVGADGYTPYIYGYFADKTCLLTVVGDGYAYHRTCAATVLKGAGNSGYMAIPTETAHTSWEPGMLFKVLDTEFLMLAVPRHADGFYLMAETEVTEGLWDAVYNGTKNTSTKPKGNVYNFYRSYEKSYTTYYTSPAWDQFVSKLNGLLVNNQLPQFVHPTTNQWYYAAEGGNKSQGYTYAGSNDIEAVAWYSGNSSGASHDVKTKAPNELGLYDMSGNVAEYTSTSSDNFNNYYYYVCGGNYESSASNCGTSSGISYYYSNCSDAIGFRPILTFPFAELDE